MEITATIRVRNREEMIDCFEFDEVLNVRFYERKRDSTYKVIIRIPECKLQIRGVTTLEKIKERVVKSSSFFTIKSEVSFADGTTRIIYSNNDYWETEYAQRCALVHNTKVVEIKRLKG